MTDWLTVIVWGRPRPHGRPRAARWKARDGRSGVSMRTAPRDRAWRGLAQSAMLDALESAGGAPPFAASGVPVKLTVRAVFPCPKSDHRKRTPQPRRWHTKRGDLDNLLKAVKDAGNGVLWIDDGQVVGVVAEKLIGAQDEAARTEVRVELVTKRPDP